ncbi:MAG: hypothetical protein EZS28_052752, partial [Streblomastix strix]
MSHIQQHIVNFSFCFEVRGAKLYGVQTPAKVAVTLANSPPVSFFIDP